MILGMFLFAIIPMMTFLIFAANSWDSAYLLEVKYLEMQQMFQTKMPLSAELDHVSMTYLFMVTLVTMVVFSYSSMYMEHYNMKKFTNLTILFFLSMVLTSTSSSWISLMTGWDLLGASSIFLVMFYPNKNSLFNSTLTMFFNRAGDVILILASIWTFHVMESTFYSHYMGYQVMVLLALCSFTKSAQFPLSSWLPAAMSAPTPISAMVHSSTLVTAGVYLVMKIFYEVNNNIISSVILVSSFTSFLVGGILANLEPDTKKVVAFSTMSQISMIMVFLAKANMGLASAHMVFHAFFKTLLFCSAGILFMKNSSNQSFKFSTPKIKDQFYSSIMMMSLAMMTGLAYTSSFYTKDSVLEAVSQEMVQLETMILLFGSVMTIMYSCKLMMKSKSSMTKYNQTSYKVSITLMMAFFAVITVVAPYVTKSLCPIMEKPLIASGEIIMITTIIAGSMALPKMKVTKWISSMGSTIMMMKELTYSKVGIIPTMISMDQSTVSEKLMMVMSKKEDKFYDPYKEMKKFSRKSTWKFIVMILILILIMKT